MQTKTYLQILCPCGIGEAYNICCHPYHQGQLPENALKLMRSRYSAYPFCIAEYIIYTTHPANPEFDHDKARWNQTIFEFCIKTKFQK